MRPPPATACFLGLFGVILPILGSEKVSGEEEVAISLESRYELDPSSLISSFIESALSAGEGLVDMDEGARDALDQMSALTYSIEFLLEGRFVSKVDFGDEQVINGVFEIEGEKLVLTHDGPGPPTETMSLAYREGRLIAELRMYRLVFLPVGHAEFILNKDLVQACHGDKVSLVRVLNRRSDYEHLPLYRVILHSLALSDRVDLIDLITDSGYPKDLKIGEHQLTPFLLAAKNGYEAAYLHLSQLEGVDCSTLDSSGRSILHYAALKSDLVLTELALEHGLDSNLEDESGYYPFYLGAKYSSSELLAKLLEAGAKMSPDREYKKRPSFREAIEAKDLDKAKLLLSFGADPQATDTRDGKSAVDLALEGGDTQILEMLKSALHEKGKNQ